MRGLMTSLALSLLPLLAGGAAARARLGTAASARAEDALWKERPVAKVAALLKDMQAQLVVEGKEDEEMYDKQACWCQTNDKATTKAVADANQKITELQADVEANTATAATLDSEIASLKTEVAKLEKALAEASALREKENAEFNSEEKDMINSIGSLKGAVVTLGKHQSAGASSLVEREALLQVSQVVRRYPGIAPRHVSRHVHNLAHGPEGAISLLQMQQPAASGQIFGLLSQMKESFENNLATSQKEETQAAESFVNVKAAKTTEIKAGKDKIFTKAEELAGATQATARAKQDLEDTSKQLEADTAFLSEVKLKCQKMDQEWMARQQTRADEIKAVGETLAIISDDDARDTMSRATSMIQAHAAAKLSAANRARAASHLHLRSRQLNSMRLRYMARRMQNDAFNKVKENIDKMAQQLDKDQKDEVGKKDGCVQDFNTNDKETSEKKDQKEDVEVEINDLESEINTVSEEKAAILQQVSDAQIEMKRASENREAENKDFQMTIADQRATQDILKKAVARMKEFYKASAAAAAAASLLQVRSHSRRSGSRQEPPAFGEYKASGAGAGVITLLEHIIERSKEVEKEALSDENEAQLAYEGFVKSTHKQIQAWNKQINNDSDVIARDTKQEIQDEGDKKNMEADLATLATMAATLHSSCDFTVNNFDERQHARAEEVEALKESKAIFSGMGAR